MRYGILNLKIAKIENRVVRSVFKAYIQTYIVSSTDGTANVKRPHVKYAFTTILLYNLNTSDEKSMKD